MRNRGLISVLLTVTCCVLLSACIDRDKYAPKPYKRALEIVKLSDNNYMHISYLKDGKGGYIGCNGYIYISDNEAIVFDTAVDTILSNQLIDFIQLELKASIKGVVVSHSHVDASGGLKSFENSKISSYASAKTAAILAKDSLFITHPFEVKQEIAVGKEVVLNQYFGEAISPDNIVSYIPASKTIVGSCMIKALDDVEGNLTDANLENWSDTVVKVKTAYPDAKHVIPGHGGYGDMSLLDNTIAMFAKYQIEEETPQLNLE